MPTLSDFQDRFARFLLAAPGTSPDPLLYEAIREQGAPTAKRLAVYKNNVYSQLIEMLAGSYPAVQRLTGVRFFRFATTEYILAHPPGTSAGSGFGEQFPQFLGTFAPAGSLPYLEDVARLEKLYLESYHAAEAPPLARAAFAELVAGEEEVRELQLHPSARLMLSPFPVSRIWEANVQARDAEAGKRVAGGTEHLLVVRPHAVVEVRRISRGAYAALVAIAEGCSVAEALAAGSKAEPRLDLVTHLLSLAAGDTFICEE